VESLTRAAAPRNQSVAALPLWAWADARLPNTSRQSLAVCVIGRRFRLTPIRAALVAELAGLSMEPANG
jgi:hypothetical protein